MVRVSRRNFLKLAGVTLASFSGVGYAENKKPNILFLFSDDQTYNALRYAGNPEIKTPNLDRLAKSGVHFTHAYNQGSWSSAVCIASRGMLNTGKFIWNAKRTADNKESAAYKAPLWPEMMKTAGYRTYFSGKWHIRKDPKDIFDVARNIRGGMPKITKEAYNRPHEGKPDIWKPWMEEYGGYWAGGKHWTDVLGDDAIDYLRDAANYDEPFFMYLAFNAPHDPRQSPKEYVDMYPLDKISLPKNFMPKYPYDEEIGSGRAIRGEKLAPYPRTEYAIKTHLQEYYAIVTHLDTQIGRILDEFETLGLGKDTYIIFTSDHGLSMGCHGLLTKQNLFEHAVRAPLIIAGPNIPRGKVADNLVYIQDVMATSLDIAGASSEPIQFNSLMPIIRSDFKRNNYDYIYGGYKDTQRMVTNGRYKLLLFTKIEKVLLFDLKNDPDEINDLYPSQELMPTVKSLFKELLRLQKETGDTFDLKKCYPELSE